MSKDMRTETILIIDDEASQRDALAGYLRKSGFQVLTADGGVAGLAAFQAQVVDLILTDLRMPDMDGMEVLRQARQLNPDIEVVLITAYGSVSGAVDAMAGGAFHFLEKPVNLDALDAIVDKALERHHQVSDRESLSSPIDSEDPTVLNGIITADPVMAQVLSVAGRAARSQATVLILGESGTGKELVARAIHDASDRQGGPFIAVNCAALSESLMESELFGHDKGAFTGATKQHMGRFEQADGGTLFIDEVGEIPAAAQVKLLRVLQERVIERVGSGASVGVDVRVVAATHRNLRQMVSHGQFRDDLYYRLNVVTVPLPPLRERRGDIPVLIDHFLDRYSRANGSTVNGLSREATDALMRYAYPGNVRELQNILERAVVMSRRSVISTEDLPTEVTGGLTEVPGSSVEGGDSIALPDQVEALERQAIREAMDRSEGVQSRAADLLGLSERNLRYKLKKYGMK